MTTIDWDAAADTFDQEPDHGLLDPAVRKAWAARMRAWLPADDEPADVLDLGCGTGSLSLLAAERGHRVTGVDRSPRMVDLARIKLAGAKGAEVLVGNAFRPPVGERKSDVVMARHVLWLLPDARAALRHWCSLLKPGGRLLLIEGVWGGDGIPAHEVTDALAPLTSHVQYERLSDDAALWGRPVDDDRYAVLARPTPRRPRHTEVVDVHLILRRGDDVLLARRAGTGYADGLLNGPSVH